MNGWKRGIVAAAVAAGSTFAPAQTGAGDARGELLYTTHCVGCHTTQVHWREKKLATDWTSLVAQVERWQKIDNLGWSADDVATVARHLNAAFYRFPVPEGKAIGERGAPQRLAHRG